jgi:hypothetical protein
VAPLPDGIRVDLNKPVPLLRVPEPSAPVSRASIDQIYVPSPTTTGKADDRGFSWHKLKNGYHFGTGIGEDSAQWWADHFAATDSWYDPARWYYGAGGLFASLWTPDTYLETAATLGPLAVEATAGRYLGLGALRAAGADAGLTAAESGAPRIVIGENMERVRAMAQRLGAETFQGTGMEANRAWIQLKKAQGYEIYDIGPDFARRLQRVEQGIRPDSLFYNMERAETLNHNKYIRVFERTGKYQGGVPGLDR